MHCCCKYVIYKIICKYQELVCQGKQLVGLSLQLGANKTTTEEATVKKHYWNMAFIKQVCYTAVCYSFGISLRNAILVLCIFTQIWCFFPSALWRAGVCGRGRGCSAAERTHLHSINWQSPPSLRAWSVHHSRAGLMFPCSFLQMFAVCSPCRSVGTWPADPAVPSVPDLLILPFRRYLTCSSCRSVGTWPAQPCVSLMSLPAVPSAPDQLIPAVPSAPDLLSPVCPWCLSLPFRRYLTCSALCVPDVSPCRSLGTWPAQPCVSLMSSPCRSVGTWPAHPAVPSAPDQLILPFRRYLTCSALCVLDVSPCRSVGTWPVLC